MKQTSWRRNIAVQIRRIFVRMAKGVIDFFQPDYFVMSIETNLLYVINPDRWGDYLELHLLMSK